MRIGDITIGGLVVGSVTVDDEPTPPANFMPVLASYETMDEGSEPGAYGRVPGHEGSPDSSSVHGAHPDVHIRDPAPTGGSRVYGRFAEARDRAREELTAKPWLNDKAMHIFAGENPDPDASTALWEETINRAAVRGTSIEQELRHTSEGGYFAGWREHVSPETRKVLEESRDRALHYYNV
jgi:hypothetical protein